MAIHLSVMAHFVDDGSQWLTLISCLQTAVWSMYTKYKFSINLSNRQKRDVYSLLESNNKAACHCGDWCTKTRGQQVRRGDTFHDIRHNILSALLLFVEQLLDTSPFIHLVKLVGFDPSLFFIHAIFRWYQMCWVYTAWSKKRCQRTVLLLSLKRLNHIW